MAGEAATRVKCAHCGLRVPPGLIDPSAGMDHQFCCHGCQTAYGVIHSCGLERYYALLRQADDGTSRPARNTARKYAEYDDEAFHRLYVKAVAGAGSGANLAAAEPAGIGGAGWMPVPLLSTELFVDNVHCAACLWLLEKLPRVVHGVIEARVELRRRAVTLVWDSSRVNLSKIASALDSLGYPPHPVRQSTALAARRAEDRRHLVRLGIAGACAGNIMLLAFSLYAGLFDGIEPVYARLFSWISLAFTVVALAWPGRVFFRGAIAAIRTRTLHLDLPIALGLGAGAVWSAYVTVFNTHGSRVAGAGGIYFDSLAMLVFALLIGRFIQHRQQRWAADSVELLFSLSPTSARLVGEDGVREVPVETIKTGQLVEVLAGDCFPVDGVVESGSSQVDLAVLTGESRPVDADPGERVAAGATNLSATLRVRVEATGADTRVGKLMKLVEECSRRRAPIVQLADRMAGWFVGAMMLLAVVTVAIWWRTDPARGVQNAIALLIVACPCGLGLATPLTMTIALGRAARAGLLIKGADALQTLAKPGVIFLDKTGTITQGRLGLIDWIGPSDLRPLVAELESHSTHPIAKALSELTRPVDTPASRVETTVGGGIAGVVGDRALSIGTARFLEARGVRIDGSMRSMAEAAAMRGRTPVFIADGEWCAVLAVLGDPLRADAKSAIRSLRGAGWDVRILSGDHAGTVAAVAGQVELPVDLARGGVTPEEKLAVIEQARREQPGRAVVMVGDGVNDAAALAAASVGVAVHGGAEASLTAADISVTRPGLSPVVDLLEGARRSMATIKLNLGVSLAYNAAAAAVCMTGVVTPLIAAILMPASSLTVLALAFRAWGRPRRSPSPAGASAAAAEPVADVSAVPATA
jgi:Cu2+-exporting ATPase